MTAKQLKTEIQKVLDTISKLKGCSRSLADTGVSLASKLQLSFGQIAEKVQKAAISSGSVAKASTDQAQGIDEINLAISDIDRSTQANAASAEQLSATSSDLMLQANTLNKIVGDVLALSKREGSTEHNSGKAQ